MLDFAICILPYEFSNTAMLRTHGHKDVIHTCASGVQECLSICDNALANFHFRNFHQVVCLGSSLAPFVFVTVYLHKHVFCVSSFHISSVMFLHSKLSQLYHASALRPCCIRMFPMVTQMLLWSWRFFTTYSPFWSFNESYFHVKWWFIPGINLIISSFII